MEKVKRERLDVTLVRRGIAKSGHKARELIKSGKVKVQGEICKKQSHLVKDSFNIEILE